jgi:hypothetical protein
MAIAEWIIYPVPISMGWPGLVDNEGHVARAPRAMIGGTSSRQTGWRDDAYDEAIQKGRKQKMDSCEDDTILKYSMYKLNAIETHCDKHIVSRITST